MERKQKFKNNEMEQEEIMNRVNQTYDKMVQDVKGMLEENNKENSIQS
ncbi:hypothetical protein [Neobacillus sp. LXY-1]